MNDTPDYSIENIYTQVGQYDRYAIFQFYPGSAAYQSYGSTVYGDVLYTPSERERLKTVIQSDNDNHSNGQVFLKGALRNKELNAQLKTIGFQASDISHLSTMDIDSVKNEYDNRTTKRIPHTVNIDFESGSFSTEKALEYIYDSRLSSGPPLIPYEQQKHITLKYLFDKSSVTEDVFQMHLFDPATGYFFNDVTITVFKFFHREMPSDIKTRSIFFQALTKRRNERIKIICKQLGIAKKHLDTFKADNPQGYAELMQVVIGFEPETIPVWGWRHSIHWDFDRFIHIYLRHYKDFLIKGSSKGQGTNFQYRYKDIRRVIEIVLKNNKEAIEAKLDAGRPFDLYDEQGYYYNGDYYTFRVDKNGRLMQFHPHEKSNITLS
ncbi:MAG: hypothetical protein V4592_14775 [Bacteroidota bacterium]